MRKIIFFDWYETLSFSKMWGQSEIENPPLFDLIQYCVFNKDPQLTVEWMRGHISFLNVIYLLLDCGVSKETTQMEFIKGMAATRFASPAYLPALKRLKNQGYKIAVATDHFDIFGAYMYPYLRLDELFNGYICSAEEGYQKQDTNKSGEYPFFFNYLKKYRLTFQDCVLIDNSKEITDLYKQFGMETHHVTIPEDVLSVMTHLETLADSGK